MPLWVWLFVGLLLVVVIGACLVAMSRAERRARRTLYRALGLGETTVGFLMERNRDVLAELTFVRGQGEAAVNEALAAAAERSRNVTFLRPALRLVRQEQPTPAAADTETNDAPWASAASDDHPRS